MPSVLITGASKGIGRAAAAEFAARGYRVIATARDPRALDGLVSNAGVIFLAAVEASPPAEIERLFAQNTVGAIRVAQAVLPQMRERKEGRLLFLSSVVGRLVLPGNAVYAASKWALEALGEALAIETAPFGIHVTLLEPGAVSSGALDAPLTHRLPDDPYAAVLGNRGDAGNFLTPEAVARAIADTAELDAPPLRVPVGGPAAALLAARKAAPEDVPFTARR